MTDLKDKLRNIVPTLHTMKEVGVNKGLAKLGDSITNLIYSLAKTVVIHQLDQRKVNKTILSNALKNAEMREYAIKRSGAHETADTVEAFLGFMYCCEKWTIDEMVQILIPILQQYDLRDYKSEIEGAIAAFTVLLKKIKKYLEIKWINEQTDEK